MSQDTRVVFDPATYVTGVPYDALARLRRRSPVVWVDEVPVLGWPGGPGFWLVLRHADVESVLAKPRLYSSWLGATQIRDPAMSADVMEHTWRAFFPEAELTILPDAGHYPMFESPVSLATSIEEFLGRE